MTERVRFATFAVRVVSILCLLNAPFRGLNLWIGTPYVSNFMTILDFFISRWKNWPLSRNYFGSWGHTFVESMCCGWVPCFLVSRPFRSRDEFLLLYGVTRCISWSDSHEVTTFLTLDTEDIYSCLYGLLCLVRRIHPWLYGLVCFVQINASLQVNLHLTQCKVQML